MTEDESHGQKATNHGTGQAVNVIYNDGHISVKTILLVVAAVVAIVLLLTGHSAAGIHGI